MSQAQPADLTSGRCARFAAASIPFSGARCLVARRSMLFTWRSGQRFTVTHHRCAHIAGRGAGVRPSSMACWARARTATSAGACRAWGTRALQPALGASAGPWQAVAALQFEQATRPEAACGRWQRATARSERSTRCSCLCTHAPRRALYHCNYCQKDISNCPRIKCAVCADFDLCLECFSVGAETTPHRAWHDYRVVDNLSFPIYAPDWGVSRGGQGSDSSSARGGGAQLPQRLGAEPQPCPSPNCPGRSRSSKPALGAPTAPNCLGPVHAGGRGGAAARGGGRVRHGQLGGGGRPRGPHQDAPAVQGTSLPLPASSPLGAAPTLHPCAPLLLPPWQCCCGERAGGREDRSRGGAGPAAAAGTQNC